MRNLTSIIKVVFLIATLAALAACGKGNSDAPQVDSNGKHPANWIAQHGAVASSSTSPCTQCHGEDLAGGIARVGCFSTPQTSFNGFVCHAASPAVKPGCNSCHGVPPDDATNTTAPNRLFAHDTHLGLNSIPNSTNNVTCSFCHNGAGFGTANHAKATAAGGIAGATVLLPDTLRAKTISTTFGYDAASGSCSGVICHGGKPTPNFRTEFITVETDCLTCHEQGTAPQTPQYNSFFSGQLSLSANPLVNLHKLHLSQNIPSTTTPVFCTNCHNTVILDTQHFVSLGTQTQRFGGLPSNTIGGSGTLINNYVPYTSTAPSGSCTSACHSVINDNPRHWINP